MVEQRLRRASLVASCPSKRLRLSLVAAGLLLATACSTPEGGDTYEAWFRPLSGFCPRYVIGEDYAWVRGKVAPTHQRRGVRQKVYTFRGVFLKDEKGELKTNTKCQGRPYPIFELYEVVSSRPLTDGEKPPGAADAAARSGQLVSSKKKEREAVKAAEEKLAKRDFALPTAPPSLGLQKPKLPGAPAGPAAGATPPPVPTPAVAPQGKPGRTIRKSQRRKRRPSRLKSRHRRSQ